ncbi:hypothetical protein CLV47_12212 [Antricoccus suffuscus]|uniref:Uncharacterized protein n=1 Tax=Antricoccus suffuscus TaxID=1629062 RepID=A0A2T0ZFQ9_9ACTN|nr:hypothetical protein [Antricoccus suffuscus]PRZ35192.1 hypothetical protein CLV47_12212 [Antricoccus suffuscus]
MARGPDNRDDPDLPNLRRFRLGSDGSTMAPVPEPIPTRDGDTEGDVASDEAQPGSSPVNDPSAEDTTLLDFDDVSDEFDETDLAQTRTAQFPTTAPSRSQPATGPVIPPSLPIASPRPTTAGADRAPNTSPIASNPRPGGPPGPHQRPSTSAPDGPAEGRKKKALWAAGIGALVILLAAFVLIAKPFGDDPVRQDADNTSNPSSRPSSRTSDSAEATPTAPNGATPDRLPPNTGGLPAPGSPRPADPDKWATKVCGAIADYQETSAGLAQDVDSVGNSAVAKAKLVTIAEKSSSVLTDLRANLSDITDGGTASDLTKIQGAVAAAADDAAASIDPTSSGNKEQSGGTFGDKIKEALERPTSTLKSEVAKLDTALHKTISSAKACEPLDL